MQTKLSLQKTDLKSGWNEEQKNKIEQKYQKIRVLIPSHRVPTRVAQYCRKIKKKDSSNPSLSKVLKKRNTKRFSEN